MCITKCHCDKNYDLFKIEILLCLHMTKKFMFTETEQCTTRDFDKHIYF